MYAPKDEEQPLAKFKGSDAIPLSPSNPVRRQKILRINLVACFWKNPFVCMHLAVFLKIIASEFSGLMETRSQIMLEGQLMKYLRTKV